MKMKISGTGSALPKKIVTNEMLSQFLDTSDEWIRTRTGISERHVISDEKLEDLAIEAALKALDNADMKADDLDSNGSGKRRRWLNWWVSLLQKRLPI